MDVRAEEIKVKTDKEIKERIDKNKRRKRRRKT